MAIRRVAVPLAAAALLTGCPNDEPELVSCNKLRTGHGMCTEYRGYVAKEVEPYACPEFFARAACPKQSLVGTCTKSLGYRKGKEQVQTDYYYRPVPAPHTPQTLRNLCQSPGRWTSGG